MAASRLPLGFINVPEEVKIRFFAKTEERYINGLRHLIWIGGKDSHGYGHFHWDMLVRTVPAHVAGFIVTNNRKPEFLCLHKNECHITSCVLGEHLYDGTAKQNTADAMEIGTAICLKPEWHANSANWHRGRKRSALTSLRKSLAGRGERHPSVKLTEAKVLLIRELVVAGQVQRHLAKEFGVSPATICNIIKRVTWPHI